MMHVVCTFSIMRAKGVRRIAIEEVQNNGKIVYIKHIFENGRWEDAYPSWEDDDGRMHIPLVRMQMGGGCICAPCHKLQKLSKESGIF